MTRTWLRAVIVSCTSAMAISSINAMNAEFAVNSILQYSSFQHSPRPRIRGKLVRRSPSTIAPTAQVGLASEARSTAGTSAKSEGRRRGRERRSSPHTNHLPPLTSHLLIPQSYEPENLYRQHILRTIRGQD